MRRKFPARSVVREDLFDTLLARGELSLIAGQREAARVSLDEALEIAQSLIASGRSSLYSERCLALALRRIGDYHALEAARLRGAASRGHAAEAERSYSQALAIWSKWKSGNLGLPYSANQERMVLRARARLAARLPPVLPAAIAR